MNPDYHVHPVKITEQRLRTVTSISHRAHVTLVKKSISARFFRQDEEDAHDEVIDHASCSLC